ncbi:hypothetical protein AMAG_02388 [Allomyces macrogynus ATCC 38327]|uniref:Amidase domain-containing protein n=1 Tax=Allomyces macrogynus (strain ATCC 38327) TaxID=578462 RepID=A0A0L0S2K7_ALLM3|nr:hypothetical protein AMAG_02388 [Allomyces macrogynus ATCC 38327]|eukprot:KNE56594.1 hypothetical protein AMAG_02388 [Allomyces macrogynus ATCC 38327]
MHVCMQLMLKLMHLPPKFHNQDAKKMQDVMLVTTLELAEALATGRVMAEQAVVAFGHQLLATHMQTNCLTDVFLKEVLARVQHLDATYQVTGKPVGKLHSLLISIKDMNSFINQPSQSNVLMVDIVLCEGANIIAKTNFLQMMLLFECSNPVFGHTANPYNLNFMLGGLLGGEGMLLTLHGL